MTAPLLLALTLTIVAEGLIAAAILRRFVWLESAAIQFTTWPVARFLLWRTGSFWTIELGVAVVEMLLWRVVVSMSWRRAALVSIAANGATAAIARLVRGAATPG